MVKQSRIMKIGAKTVGTVLCISTMLSGCSAENKATVEMAAEKPTDEYIQYVQLCDYKAIKTDIKQKEVTDEEIEELYGNVLINYPYIVDDPDGIVDKGDTVSLTYTIKGTDTENTFEGVVGSEEFPPDISDAIISHKLGEVVETEASDSAPGYSITINRIQKDGEVTDEYIASLDIDGAKSISQLKRNIKVYIKTTNHKEYKESVEEDLIAKIYDSSTFSTIPDEYVQPFKDILMARLDNVIYAYSLDGEEKTYDDVLETTYEKDGIDTVQEYLDTYGLQNARTYAICAAIAEKEGIEADITDIYSLAAEDWANVKDTYETLADFLKENGLETYRKAVLMNTVKDYLFEMATDVKEDDVDVSGVENTENATTGDNSKIESDATKEQSADTDTSK